LAGICLRGFRKKAEKSELLCSVWEHHERRNQLHEVIRLSGMNLIIDDTDHPLIIKVASISVGRMQVYFIDNEDYFTRKFVLKDGKNRHYKDNDERMIFFARGAIETVKKLRWSPDIILVMAGLPVLFRCISRNHTMRPAFHDSKIIFSAYNDGYNDKMDANFIRKVKFDGIDDSTIAVFKDPTFVIWQGQHLISDGIIMGSKTLPAEIEPVVKEFKVPVLKYQNPEDYIDAYSVFYDKI